MYSTRPRRRKDTVEPSITTVPEPFPDRVTFRSDSGTFLLPSYVQVTMWTLEARFTAARIGFSTWALVIPSYGSGAGVCVTDGVTSASTLTRSGFGRWLGPEQPTVRIKRTITLAASAARRMRVLRDG